MSKTVAVVAPSNLEAGYQFQATAEGKTFMVTVPEGGVKEGEQFQVPFPDDTMATAGMDKDAVKGKWKVGLFDSCNVAAGYWWMACCCSPILMAQVMQRLGLNAIGSKSSLPDPTKGSACMIISVITVICSLVYFLRVPLLIYIVVIGTRYRMYMRRKYDIPTDNCGDGVEDCCCVFWCSCCVACQTHKHTHDDIKYPYSCFAPTGLAEDAPSVV